MIEITRINLLGEQVPWWSNSIMLREIRRLSSYRLADAMSDCCQIMATSRNIQRYGKIIDELRHSTMLEF